MPFARTAPTPSRSVTRLARSVAEPWTERRKLLAEDEVDLRGLDLAAVLEVEQHDMDDVVVDRDLRPLVALLDVLGDQRVQPSVRATARTVCSVGVGQVDPEAGVGLRGDQSAASASRSVDSATPDGDQQTIRTGSPIRAARRRDPARRRFGVLAQRAIVGRRSSRPSGSSAIPPAAGACPRRSSVSIRVRAAPPGRDRAGSRRSSRRRRRGTARRGSATPRPPPSVSSASTTKAVAQRPVPQLGRDDRLPAVGLTAKSWS